MARKRTVETHEFKKGQRLMLDEIYTIQGLAGGDWWAAQDPSVSHWEGGDAGENHGP